MKQKIGVMFTRKSLCINRIGVKVKGEGRNCELAECAMRRGVSVRAYEAAEEETANAEVGKERASFPQENGEEEEKRRGVSKESLQVFVQPLPVLKKRNIFLAKGSIIRN